jgi:DNA-directed RNA polymerase subunit RPC12/RpoP
MEKRIKIKKVQYACIDCGKLSRIDYPSEFHQSRENYRCQKCAIKYNGKPSIEKVQYSCIDCGKLSMWGLPSEFHQSRENYRCHECATKYYGKRKRNVEKVQYACIDCGKLSRIDYPKNFSQQRENYRCLKCAQKDRVKKVQYTCIDCDKLSTWRLPSEFGQPRENYRCLKCAAKEVANRLEVKEKRYKRITMACADCGKEKTYIRSYFKNKNPYLCKRCMIKRRDDDPQYVKNKSIRMLKWHKEHPGAVKGENNGRYGVKESDESKKQNSLRIKKLYENKEFHDKVTKANREASLNINKRMKKSATDRGISLSEWDGFVTPLNYSIRNCDKMRQWRFAVFKRDRRRDWFSGVACGKNAEAHHVIPFNKLLKLYKIKSLEQAINCDALWEVSNGVTMLKSSHDAYHSMWGNCK